MSRPHYQGSAPQNKSDELRIVLLGKTGAGKSAAGNTILGRKAFQSQRSSSSWTFKCQRADGEVGGRKVTVIDTPGLFDTKLTQEEVFRRIQMCIPLSTPGPHVFLLVLRLGRFTQEEKETVRLIHSIFGEEAAKYSIVLFTHGDSLKEQSIESFISKSEDLKELIRVYSGRYHVFNNLAKDEVQSRQLLEKVVRVKLENSGGHYTTEMYEDAETKLEIEEQRRSKEQEEVEEVEREFTGGKRKKRRCLLQ